jgi:hypothetical protein
VWLAANAGANLSSPRNAPPEKKSFSFKDWFSKGEDARVCPRMDISIVKEPNAHRMFVYDAGKFANPEARGTKTKAKLQKRKARAILGHG